MGVTERTVCIMIQQFNVFGDAGMHGCLSHESEKVRRMHAGNPVGCCM